MGLYTIPRTPEILCGLLVPRLVSRLNNVKVQKAWERLLCVVYTTLLIISLFPSFFLYKYISYETYEILVKLKLEYYQYIFLYAILNSSLRVF